MTEEVVEMKILTEEEQTRRRIRKAIRRGQLARKVVEIAFIVLMIIVIIGGICWMTAKQYECHQVFSTGTLLIDRPVDKVTLLGAGTFAQRFGKEEEIPPHDAILYGGNPIEVRDAADGKRLYTMMLWREDLIRIATDDGVHAYRVPHYVFTAVDNVLRRINQTYDQEVPRSNRTEQRILADTCECIHHNGYCYKVFRRER